MRPISGVYLGPNGPHEGRCEQGWRYIYSSIRDLGLKAAIQGGLGST